MCSIDPFWPALPLFDHPPNSTISQTDWLTRHRPCQPTSYKLWFSPKFGRIFRNEETAAAGGGQSYNSSTLHSSLTWLQCTYIYVIGIGIVIFLIRNISYCNFLLKIDQCLEERLISEDYSTDLFIDGNYWSHTLSNNLSLPSTVSSCNFIIILRGDLYQICSGEKAKRHFFDTNLENCIGTWIFKHKKLIAFFDQDQDQCSNCSWNFKRRINMNLWLEVSSVKSW